MKAEKAGPKRVSLVAAFWFVAYRLAERGRKAAVKSETDAQLRRSQMRSVDWLN